MTNVEWLVIISLFVVMYQFHRLSKQLGSVCETILYDLGTKEHRDWIDAIHEAEAADRQARKHAWQRFFGIICGVLGAGVLAWIFLVK
jgi:hypothetical protein